MCLFKISPSVFFSQECANSVSVRHVGIRLGRTRFSAGPMLKSLVLSLVSLIVREHTKTIVRFVIKAPNLAHI